MRSFLLYILLMLSVPATAQDTSVFKYPISMDEVVISAKRGGWDVAGFIKRVQDDTTFYKAFKSMRVTPYVATNDVRVYNKKGKISLLRYKNKSLINKVNPRDSTLNLFIKKVIL